MLLYVSLVRTVHGSDSNPKMLPYEDNSGNCSPHNTLFCPRSRSSLPVPAPLVSKTQLSHVWGFFALLYFIAAHGAQSLVHAGQASSARAFADDASSIPSPSLTTVYFMSSPHSGAKAVFIKGNNTGSIFDDF